MLDTRPVSRPSNVTGAVAAPVLKHLVIAVALTLGGAQFAAAGPLPDGQNVVQGSATVTTPTGTSMLVNVTSNKAVINWNGFSIANGNQVQFVQPSSSAVTLNRVTGGAASNIDGSLLANGQLFLVNQNGVFFGAGAQVNVGGLIASTLDISDSNFMAGTYDFAKVGGSPTGQIVNNATITIGSRGYAALLGEQVSNGAAGVIDAPLGKIVLAAGERVSVNLANDQLLSFSVDPTALASGGYVQNAGQLLADGGTVMLTARVTNALAGAVVNQSGVIRAQGVVEKNGEVYLSADGGDIEVGGSIDVNAQAGAHGGTIGLAATGGNAILTNSGVLQAKGTAGASDGGSISISGDRVELRGQVDLARGAGGNLGTLALTAGDLSIGQGSAAMDAACTVPGTCASISQLDAQAVLRGANLTMTATRASGNATLSVGDLSANGGSGMIDGRNAGTGGALGLNAVATNGAASVQFDNTANRIYTDGNLNVSARGGTAADLNVGVLSAARLDLRSTLPGYVPGVSTSGSISAGTLTASATGDTGITLIAAGQLTLNGDATAQSATGSAMLNFSGDAVNLGNGTVSATAPLVSIANIQSGNGAVTQGASGVLRVSTTATALESANAGGAYAALTVSGQGSHQLAGTTEALTGGDWSQAALQVTSTTGSLTIGQAGARAGDNGYAATVNLSAAGNITTTGTLDSYAAAGPGALGVSAGGAVQFGGNVTLQGTAGSYGAVLASINAGSGNLGMAAGTQISVTDNTAAGVASLGAALGMNSGQGQVQAGNVAVASTSGAAQVQINGNTGVALDGNVAVTGASAVVNVSAPGNGTDISLAAGKTVSATSNTAGGGGALVNIDNPNGTLTIPHGSLVASAPAGDVAGVVTNPVIAAPAPAAPGSTSAATAVALSAEQSLLSRLLGMARSTPVNPLANNGLIVMPAWNIVPRTVYSGGGIDAALFDEEGIITPTSEIIIDADPVNAAMKK